MARVAFVITFAILVLSQAPLVKAETGSDAVVQDDFLALCADCHGADARGNGPLTKNLTKVPPDLTRIQERANGKFEEKAVFDWILGLNTPNFHGNREMPIWGDWLMDETLGDSTSLDAAPKAERVVERRVMALVKYLKGLQLSQ